MTILTSKVEGMDFWAYDVARRPDKTLIDGLPQLNSYSEVNTQGDKVNPVTHEPTEFTQSPINQFRYVFDVNHCSNGSDINTHGIKWTNTDPIEGLIQTKEYASVEKYNNAMFYGDDIYLKPKLNPNTGKPIDPFRKQSKTPFTTETPGIKILYQTGIVKYSQGYAVIMFEVEQGYKIPAGATITATPKVQNAFSGKMVDGTPETYKITHDVVPGVYEITVTADQTKTWFHCQIDFQTKQDTSTLPHSKVTFTLTHCTVEPSDTTVINGVHSWTFTADNGYVFNSPGGIVNPNTGKRGDEIPATKTNTTTLRNYNVQNDIEIQLTAQNQQTETIPFVQNLTHARSNVTSASIGRKLNAISLTADNGYIFQTSVQVLFYSGGQVVSEYNVDGNNTDTITIPLNTTKENTITDNMDNIQLTATATLDTMKAGYEHNYLITETELNSFSNDHIWNYVGGETGEESYNVSQYINNLIELPFKVTTTTTVNKISVGRLHSSVVSHEAKSRFVTLELGTIKVPAKYNNGYDYQNKIIKLYSPFISPITINDENAIEKSIHISYKIDISNGNATINLDNEGILFYTGIANIASQLPFLNTLKNTIINRNTHFTDNNIRQPYLVITRETPILNSDYYPTIERGTLNSYTGNVKATELNNLNIPDNEQSSLNQLLQKGVRINANND